MMDQVQVFTVMSCGEVNSSQLNQNLPRLALCHPGSENTTDCEVVDEH